MQFEINKGAVNRYFGGLIILILVLSSCAQPIVPLTPTLPATTLSVGYVDSVTPLVELIAPIFSEEEPSINLSTRIGYFSTLMDDLADMDAVILPGDPALNRQDAVEENDTNQWMSVIALDGLSIIVNVNNPISGLSLSQVQAIYRGQAWSWDMVGGTDADIMVVTSDNNTAISALFKDMVMGPLPETLTAVLAADSGTTIDFVAQNTWAIGYIAASVADDRVKQLAIEGQYPEPEILLAQEYPLSYPIYMITKEEPKGDLRKFATWLLSPDGQAVMSKLYGRVR